MSNLERGVWGANTGEYSICFYAYTPFSAAISVTEFEMGNQFDITNGQIRTKKMFNNDWDFGRYRDTGLGAPGVFDVYVEVQELASGEEPPKIYYKMCEGDCSLNGDIAQNGFTELSCTIYDLKTRNCTHTHLPSACPNGNYGACQYIWVVQNQYQSWKTVSFRVFGKFQDPGDVDLTKIYINSLNEGEYFFYELNPATNANLMPYLSELRIKLKALRGDADIFASIENTIQTPTIATAGYKSRTGALNGYDEITIYPVGGRDVFRNSIYFSAFAETYCQYQITFDYKFVPEYNALLEGARAIGEGQYATANLGSESDEALYSFNPWWSARENRTVGFFADMIANRVFFYTKWNAYPKHFSNSVQDVNDTVAIYGSNHGNSNNVH